MLSDFDRAQVEYYKTLSRIQFEYTTAEEKDKALREERKIIYGDFTEEQKKEVERLGKHSYFN